MDTIESIMYVPYSVCEGGEEKIMYICVPTTLVIMKSQQVEKSQFIFWN
jgi:hypothetical protein